MPAEKAWLIPWKICQEFGTFEFSELYSMELNQVIGVFQTRKLHRFPNDMAKNFCSALQMIAAKYDDLASHIWNGTPRSGTIIRRFLAFTGVGLKIATMATNILARDFKVPMQDHRCIDISPDVQVSRVLYRLGFITSPDSIVEAMYCARELYPEFPGIIDFSLWEIGRNWCRPRNRQCQDCYLCDHCPKVTP